MQISGIEKLSLVDYDENIVCTIFTTGCNMRCPFCHNAPLVLSALPNIDEKEIFAFLNKRKSILDGVCVSGGEPTLQPDLPLFLAKVKALGLKVKLDTNGSNPDVLNSLINNRLIDYVAMDIKNSAEKYSLTSGVLIDVDKITRSLNLLKHGKIDYELRTTLVCEFHTMSDITAIGQWINGAKRMFLQKFVAKDSCLGDNLSAVPKDTAQTYVSILSEYVGTVKLRGYE